MSLIPAVSNPSDRMFTVVTAKHCFPGVVDDEVKNLKVTLHLQKRNGFIPVQVSIPLIENLLRERGFVEKHLLSKLNPENLGLFMTEYASTPCTQKTQIFSNQIQSSDKIACFSRFDSIILPGSVNDTNTNALALYDQMAKPSSEAIAEKLDRLPVLARDDMKAIWTNLNQGWKMRRNTKALAYLSNLQFCAASNTSGAALAEQPESDPKAMCSFPPLIRERYILQMSVLEEREELRKIIYDTSTPLQTLRDRYFACTRNSNSLPDVTTPCQAERAADNAYNRWMRQGESLWKSLPEAEKSKFPWKDFFAVVTRQESETSSTDATIKSIPLVGSVKRSSLSSTLFPNLLLFSYLHDDSFFKFEKGDSGSLLTIFGDYPIAVLSTIDGVPTSGGAALLPLPAPTEEDDAPLSKSAVSCK